MESTTETKVNHTPPVETRQQPPLPASERDLHWKQASRNPRFRLALIVGGAQKKVLAARERYAGSSNLQLVADDEVYPLRCQTSEREIGFAVQERTAAAVLYFGGTSYVDYTF